MVRPTYADLGLPVVPGGDLQMTGTFFNPPTSCVLVAVGPVVEKRGVRVFLLCPGAATYREILTGRDEHYFTDVTVASEAPIAFVRVRNSTSPPEATISAVTLPDGVLHPIPAPVDRGSRALWVNEVLSASADGTFVYVVIGYRAAPRADGSYTVDFAISRMSVHTGVVEELVELRAVFA
jgi:hypothetical protein